VQQDGSAMGGADGAAGAGSDVQGGAAALQLLGTSVTVAGLPRWACRGCREAGQALGLCLATPNSAPAGP